MHACSNLSGVTWRGLSQFCLTQTSGQKSSGHCLKMLLGELTTCGCLGQKIMAQIYNRLPKFQEEKLGKILQEIGTLPKHLSIQANLESYTQSQGKIHAQKRPEKILSSHLGPVPRLSISLTKLEGASRKSTCEDWERCLLFVFCFFTFGVLFLFCINFWHLRKLCQTLAEHRASPAAQWWRIQLHCRRGRKMLVRFLSWEDPLEEEMTTHSCILAWRILRTEEPGRLQSMGSQRVRHDWACAHHADEHK